VASQEITRLEDDELRVGCGRAAALWLLSKRNKYWKYECIKTSENVRKMVARCNFGVFAL